MKILSLCDGLSGGHLALLGLDPFMDIEYHAIEIDPHARKLSDANLPSLRWENDVTKITKEQIQDNGPYDWVMFGFPCQSLSVSGNGKGLEGKSGLLIQCLQVLKWAQEFNPRLKFLIENVKMKKDFFNQVNDLIGCEPILINSKLVSAQNRERYYWTNFKVSQPEDRKIFLDDILEEGFSDREKSHCLDANYAKGASMESYFEKSRRQIAFGWSKSTRYKDEEGRVHSKKALGIEKYIEQRITPDKSNTLMTGEGCGNQSSCNFVVQINPDKSAGGKQPHMQDRIYSTKAKSPSLTACFANRLNISEDFLTYRKLTVLECARLQTIPEWFNFSSVSKTQAYKAIGNGWTAKIISHIIKCGMDSNTVEGDLL